MSEKDFVDPLDGVDPRAHWRDFVTARSVRWAEAREKFMELRAKHKGLREQTEDIKWASLVEKDGQVLRTWEGVMIRCFVARNLTELDKACWLVSQGRARFEQDEIPGIREGKLGKVTWISE